MALGATGMCSPKVPAAGEVPLFLVRCAGRCGKGVGHLQASVPTPDASDFTP